MHSKGFSQVYWTYLRYQNPLFFWIFPTGGVPVLWSKIVHYSFIPRPAGGGRAKGTNNAINSRPQYEREKSILCQLSSYTYTTKRERRVVQNAVQKRLPCKLREKRMQIFGHFLAAPHKFRGIQAWTFEGPLQRYPLQFPNKAWVMHWVVCCATCSTYCVPAPASQMSRSCKKYCPRHLAPVKFFESICAEVTQV